ncbi:MAG TPA: FAD-dependent oxidoreductase [Candidatus Acidoferrum sp.]|nr:FAD-dependent oxidoreductase [Candidatus Acidoferrum sp.]
MQVIFDHTEPAAQHIQTFWFRPLAPVQYVAGQFTQLRIPHDNADERGTEHYFTLSSSPTEDKLSITTKFAERSSTFKQALRQLRSGTELTMAEPDGEFTLPADESRPLVFVAGGIGITPIRSMVKWLTDVREHRDIQLIYAVTDFAELAFEHLFVEYGLEFIPVVTNPPEGWAGETGRLDSARIVQLIGDIGDKLFYLSGPEPMVEGLAGGLPAQGVPKEQIVTDFFPGYSGI